MAQPTHYHFLSYVRRGFAAALTQVDPLNDSIPAVATAAVGIKVSGVDQKVAHDAVVRGPGDVIGISASQVIRTDPIPGAVGVEPNYFTQVEFDLPDLPWLFTPAAASGQRLRPWLVLVVVDAEGDKACTLRAGDPLRVLHVPAAAADTLPDLAGSHLWAHAQVIPESGTTVHDALAPGGDPRRNGSRLLCPRHLAPNTSYIAAVVPAFEVGRLAGLGQRLTSDDEAKLEPAWKSGAAVDLPVYYSWRFRTGEDADFERLARRLKKRTLPSGVGTRSMDVSRPGAGLPELPVPADTSDTHAVTWLAGALRPVESTPGRDAGAQKTFANQLTVLLDRPDDLVKAGDKDPVVAPPIYGDKHARVVRLDGGSVPPWLSELNLHARARVAAGVGTQVVQARQEDYVARAWKQLGEVLAANRLLRLTQLARSGSLRAHQRLGALDAPTLLPMSYPLQERLVGALPGGTTLRHAIAATRLPSVSVDPALRRVARASTSVGRAAGAARLVPDIVHTFASKAFVAPTGGPDGSTGMRPAAGILTQPQAEQVLHQIDAGAKAAGQLDTVLQTLSAHPVTLPNGAAIRNLPLRTDAGAVAMLHSLGVVPAGAIHATLDAAKGAAHKPPPTVGRSAPAAKAAPKPRPPKGARIARAVSASKPMLLLHHAAPSRRLSATTALHAGTVVSHHAVVRDIAAGKLKPVKLSGATWQHLVHSNRVPAIDKHADPGTDAGARLALFRQNPKALQALAKVASGDVANTVALDGLSASLFTSGAAAADVQQLAKGHLSLSLPVVRAGLHGGADLGAGHELLTATAQALDRMVRIGDSPPAATPPPLDLEAVRTGLLARTDPELTLTARINARLDLSAVSSLARRDVLDPVMAYPHFDDAMWKALHALGHGWLLPGLEDVPPDTVTLVATNPSFVAAHMVGLNQEMMSELLWREYPTDQRGTPFRRFWGRGGSAPDDIKPVHQFSGTLTDNLLSGGAGEAVLLLRSELLRRYPGSIIYLCRGKNTSADDPQLDESTITTPSFRGDFPPDISFVGFPVTPEQLRATTNPWWFVIAQPPAEPRFGLDDPTPTTPIKPTSASDLAWNHMSADGNPDTPVPFATANPPMLHDVSFGGAHWGDSAAVQARLTYQHPVRIAIRASTLLPTSGTS